MGTIQCTSRTHRLTKRYYTPSTFLEARSFQEDRGIKKRPEDQKSSGALL
jgi:hypothetical protein